VSTFVKRSRQRSVLGAELGAVDCRAVTKSLVSELAPQTRFRRGQLCWNARRFDYHDAGFNALSASPKGVNELDERRVVLHSFYSWSQLDDADRIRRRRREQNRVAVRPPHTGESSNDLLFPRNPSWLADSLDDGNACIVS